MSTKPDREAALGFVSQASELARQLDELTRQRVAVARFAGASWERVGAALGVTRSAAWQKYGKPGTVAGAGDLPPGLFDVVEE